MFLQPPSSNNCLQIKKKTHKMKTPVSREKRISVKSPMIPVQRFEEDKKSIASSSSGEYTPSPTNFRREIASNVIGVTYFDTSKYSNPSFSKAKPGPVSNFSTNKSSAKHISKKNSNSKCCYETDSDDDGDKSSSSNCLSWEAGKSANPY